jgi:tetratricopeptide (TPR) repeat protein
MFERMEENVIFNTDWIKFGTGMVYLKKGDLNRAEKIFTALVNDSPSFAYSYEQLGYFQKKRGDQNQANIWFRKALDRLPEDEKGFYHRGLLLIEFEQFDAALDSFSTVAKLNPFYYDATLNLAIVNGKKKDFEKAENLIKDLYRTNPEQKDGYARLGWIKTETQDWSGALDLMDKDRKLDRITPAWKINLAQVYGRRGEWDQAIRSIEEAYSTNTNLKDGYARLGWIKCEEKDWLGVREIMVRDLTANRISPGWRVNLAQIYGRSGEWDIAFELIKDAYSADSELKDGYSRLGWIEAENQNWVNALEIMNLDREAKRLSTIWQVNLAQMVARSGKFDRAKEMITIAYAMNKDLKDGFARLGWIKVENQDWAGALELMERDSKIKRLSSAWQRNMAMAQVFNGDFAIAIKFVEEQYVLDNSAVDGYAYLGWAKYLLSGNEKELFLFIEKDIALDRLSTEGRKIKAWSMSMRGKKRQAVALMDSLYEKIPSLKNGFAVMGWEFIKRGKIEEGLDLIDKDYLLKRLTPDWVVSYTYQLAMYGRGEKARFIYCQSFKLFSQKNEFRIGYQSFPLLTVDKYNIQKILNL